MTQLSEEDVKRLADAFIQRIRSEHNEFWVEPERHYNDHQTMSHLDVKTIIELKTMLDDWRKARGVMWKLFLYLIAAGTAIGAAWQLLTGGWHK